MKDIQSAVMEIQSELIEFARDLVRIKSYSGDEEEIIRFIEGKMKELAYDEVIIDAMGNLVGRMGKGEKIIMFDSHIDTVQAEDLTQWIHDPFSGVIEDGRLCGRGSVDMKSAAAASVYAGALAKKLYLLEDKTLYVSCTVMEEDCDGENLKHLFQECCILPDYMIICEPSGNQLVTGHKGKAQVAVKTRGISAHGSAPEKGLNAIYEMAEIITRIEQTGNRLMKSREPRGTLVASRISSLSESLNAVPFECEIYLDRRMVTGETLETLEKEMDAIVRGRNASWKIGTLKRKSWTGMDVTYEPFHTAWEIDPGHDLTKACIKTFQTIFRKDPEPDYWDFSTNAVTPVAMGIPTIGFGPGEYKLAHMVNENCETRQISDACKFYSAVMERL
ncbi:YgeY family selenium metabolism-linked hydrolase [Desulfospira joergensenii]|uniref:YgeY family selenium metabolism-linked hydrolase n=1 Tax=Desulfospira joergensenii TaxID=53329 RepID=UPI0003B3D564|nr:YgeY family selenium metabolism-linked hydrolase [Desulfospira joergensenii]